MIGRIWFKRTEDNKPVLCLASSVAHLDDAGSFKVSVASIKTFFITEELYDQWVPDTNYFPGESLSEGIVYDKPLIPNLKA